MVRSTPIPVNVSRYVQLVKANTGHIPTKKVVRNLWTKNQRQNNLLVRQLQLVEERTAQQQEARRAAGSSSSSYDDSHLYLGLGATRGGVMVAPALQKYIAEQLALESAVLKERRKAREERALARPKKGPKGDKNGDG